MAHPYMMRKQKGKMKHSSQVTPAQTQGSARGRAFGGAQGSTSPSLPFVFDPCTAGELSEAHTRIKNGNQEELDAFERELDRFDWRQW